MKRELMDSSDRKEKTSPEENKEYLTDSLVLL